ncbi:MAG: helix-turn-helix transcriptional regulator [Lactobacillus sp.]|uniref:Helix-turn-helix transcriptional regulator n=1 Tax=Lactobacillus helsingborgensis TaxID=1218494 RepID=A0AA47B5S8_9LACO|nr:MULTISPECIES: helix-turn-helix transcriptional regulator [Lactobacillus]MCT6888621.1 helix-turn-helix transcriptional regulator [Lactobacillus sp.]AWN34321.1 replication protein B [Lactobacillus helsingborgensis]MCT6902613.1 helix-turn-helix transcriptional regulator [Lactobacillus sp.]RMC52177.1 ArsR family transcriptional regulator [Lactobacillus sp. ESL0262]UZX30645.1 helix-turn-helix transcriptional regulator [Lactobacillus helsingborgensis]
MQKTIKQLADELHVSKQTIRYHLKSLPVNFTGKDNKNRITVNAIGARLIKEKVVNKSGNVTGKKVQQKSSLPVNDNEQLKLLLQRIDTLEQTYHEQLLSKDQEIARLHDTLDQTQKLLNQSQQLQLMAEKKINKLKEISSNKTNKRASRKKGWWHLIINRND